MVMQIIEVSAVLIGIYLVLTIDKGGAFEKVAGAGGKQFIGAVTALQGGKSSG
jgi:hypothetical protein